MDKLAKVRAEVARIQLYTQSEVLKQVLDYIDKVQEDPVSKDLEKAEKFIQEHTKNCINIIETINSDKNVAVVYQPWLTPDQAREAVEIARKEMIEWLEKNIYMYNGECEGDRTAIIEDLKQAMKDE